MTPSTDSQRIPAEAAQQSRWRPPVLARIGISFASFLLALSAFAIIIFLAPTQWTQLQRIVQHPLTALKFILQYPLFTLIIIFVPIIVYAITYNGLRLSFLIYGWRHYLSRLQKELEARISIRAPLTSLGYLPSVRGSLAGTPGTPPRESLASALAVYPRLILAGDDGAGKTVALWQHAHEIAMSATIRRILAGRQMVPIIIPLVSYAQAEPAADGLRLGYLADTLRQYGATMLAGQLPVLLRRGRVLLMFDGLDELPDGQMQSIVQELNTGLRQRYRNVRIILTCRATPLNEIADYLPLLKHLPQAILQPLERDEIRQVVRRAAKNNRLGAATSESVLGEIEQRALWPIYNRPATLAMLIDLLASGQPIPAIRARLLNEYEEVLFARAGIAGDRLERTRRAMGYLSIALLSTGMAEISGAQAWNERTAVKGLLADNRNSAPNVGGNTRPLGFSEMELTEAIDLACLAGVLERGRNNIGLRFRHALLLNIAAARHLETNDSGLGRISANLLRSEWTEVLILWGGLTNDPFGLAERLVRLAKTPAGTAATARLGNATRGEPLALALALTVAVIGMTAMAVSGEKKKADSAQHGLRDLFDRVLQFGAYEQDDRGQRQLLTTALRICEDAAGSELTPALARLVREPGVNRLLRAQAVQVLGLLASPASLQELNALLLEPDAIVRESLQRGFHLAGADAVDALLDLMVQYPNTETIHRRALDALIAVDGPAVVIALNRLENGNNASKVAATEALGGLHDRRALEPLLAALKDTNAVLRVTAARALGRLGDLKAQPALLNLLQASDQELRIAVAEALGLLRSDKSITPLITLLEDQQPRVRAAAAEALGHLGDKQALEPLRRHLSDRDAWAQAAAATALRALGQRA